MNPNICYGNMLKGVIISVGRLLNYMNSVLNGEQCSKHIHNLSGEAEPRIAVRSVLGVII